MQLGSASYKNILLSMLSQPYKTTKFTFNAYNYIFILSNTIKIIIILF